MLAVGPANLQTCVGKSTAFQVVFGGGVPDGVATLKVRKGAFDALNKGSGALGKVK